jgi:ATP-dependent DNA ligase
VLDGEVVCLDPSGRTHFRARQQQLHPTDPADVAAGLAAGKLSFTLHGDRLNGRFSLVRMRGGTGMRENWLLIKGRDEYA